jgi:WD40 repeat protein
MKCLEKDRTRRYDTAKPGEEDLRGWEWRYLWQLTQSSAWVTLTNRPPPVRGFSVDFSPDGSRLAVGWSGGQVDLWDVPARQWIRALTDHGHARQGQVAFSRIRNRLVATSTPNTVTLYDLDSGRESIVWRGPDTGSWVIRDLSFSQDDTKVVIYAGAGRDHGDAAWVVHAASGEVESQHPADWSDSPHHGAARLSPDNRLLFLSRSDSVNYRYHIQCLDLATGEEVWQTAPERDFGLSALAVSPDGQMLVSGSGFEDPTIRVWDAATGRLVVRLDGHTAWVCKLVFTSDGTRLVSAASDQSIRFWDAATWTEVKVLRGHTDEVHAVAVSIPVELTASTGKDGSLLLWKEEELGATDGYTRLPEVELALPLDRSRLLLLRSGQPLKLLNLERDTPIGLVPNIASSHDLLGWEPDRFSDLIGQLDGKLLCHWNGIDRILVHELQDAQFVARGAIPVDSGIRPTGLVSNPARQLLAWTEPVSPMSVFLASLKSPGRRIELRGDVPGLIPFGFSEDGVFLMATTRDQTSVRVWNVENGQMVASLNELVRAAAVAAAGRVLVAALHREGDHEIGFFDLVDPSRPARRVAGFGMARRLAVSPDGELVASSTYGGLVRLFDPFQAEVVATLHGHMNAAFGVAFSPDGRRLISTSGGREAVKLWDVSTRQELLTLTGGGSFLVTARWSADGRGDEGHSLSSWLLVDEWQRNRAARVEQRVAAVARRAGLEATVDRAALRTAEPQLGSCLR